jgi:hypothetical protein
VAYRTSRLKCTPVARTGVIDSVLRHAVLPRWRFCATVPGEWIRGRLRQEPLSPLDQRMADCLGFTSERRLCLLTLKRPFREAACSVRWKAVASGRWGEQSRELIAAASDRYVRTCIYAPGISPRRSTQSLFMPLLLSLAYRSDCMKCRR